LEANTGGRINAEGATIPGDLPFQFGKAESGGIIHMPGLNATRQPDGTILIKPGATPTNQAFPPPTGEFKNLSEHQIKQRAQGIAAGLRGFQERFTADWKKLPVGRDGHPTDADFNAFSEKWKIEYEAKYIHEAHSLVSEYLARGHQITPDDRMAGMGGTMLFYKSFAGPIAALQVAAFLDYLAKDGRRPELPK
jgi:hypothetical protein